MKESSLCDDDDDNICDVDFDEVRKEFGDHMVIELQEQMKSKDTTEHKTKKMKMSDGGKLVTNYGSEVKTKMGYKTKPKGNVKVECGACGSEEENQDFRKNDKVLKSTEAKDGPNECTSCKMALGDFKEGQCMRKSEGEFRKSAKVDENGESKCMLQLIFHLS